MDVTNIFIEEYRAVRPDVIGLKVACLDAKLHPTYTCTPQYRYITLLSQHNIKSVDHCMCSVA